MKFRGKMTELTCMKQFSSVVQTLKGLSRLCVLRLCADRFHFIISPENMGQRGAMVWCTLDQTHFFSEYNMKGVTEEDNEIYLELAPDMLIKALNSLKFSQVAKSVKIKLTNKIHPCLTFEVELPSTAMHSRICVHDVPVNTIPRRDWPDYRPPDLPRFDVGIEVPSLKTLRGVVDRMKALQPHVIMSANKLGSMCLKVNTDTASIAMHFRDLRIVDADQGRRILDNDEENEEDMFSVRLDAKRLSSVLTSELLHPRRVLCHILDDQMLHMVLEHEDVLMHYCVTAVSA
ncbi:Checkpoint protein HUS1 [Frankliniella fusca]|uniref:Checkpoint protein n=1 Tax=Frankliniella fusca TaxID=407009 RepID=A0AAE1HSW7_9NEOP|nr:Checkpoint protein HUS1 [Frankliniella fusca]